MRVNWWPWNGGDSVVINNNYGGGRRNYYDSWGCCGGYRGTSLFEKMMMYSFVGNFLNQTINNVFHRGDQQQQYVPPYACNYAPTMYPGLYLQQGAKPESAGGTIQSKEEQDNLKRQAILQENFAKVEVLSDGTVLALDKNKKIIKANSVDELLDMVIEQQQSTQKPAADEADDVDVTDRKKVEETDDGADSTPAADEAGDTDIHTPKTGNSRKVKIPEGWYRATADGKFGNKLKKVLVDTRKKGYLAAKHFAEQLIRLKYDSDDTLIKDFDIERFAADIAMYNPSLFDENGNYKQGINIDECLKKLDIPSQDVIVRTYKKS